MKRADAERLLLLHPQNDKGSYLVRDSESAGRTTDFSLSIRDSVDSVKHYRIRLAEEGAGTKNKKHSLQLYFGLIFEPKRETNLFDYKAI